MANDPRFEVYPRKAGLAPVEVLEGPDPEANWPVEFGWRFRAANGQISAVGGEGFTRREDAKRAVADFVLATRIATYGLRFAEAVATSVVDFDE